jgi:O-methyltransferase involved in polyketide biosynthesis
MEMAKRKYERISYTASGVAYARTFSDIRYCKEIAALCNADSIPPSSADLHRRLSPYFEGRFKAQTVLLKKSGLRNIIELAAGLSPRGLIMTEDPDIHYVETDLPEMLHQKQVVASAVMKKQQMAFPKNLRFAEVNVLDKESFARAVAQLPKGPIAIGHEGLLAYFTREEKRTLAGSVRDILEQRGGIWITPDIFTRADLAKSAPNEKMRKSVAESLKNTESDYRANVFVDNEDAETFFSALGFNCTRYAIGDIAGYIASTRFISDRQYVKNLLSLSIWELRPKPGRQIRS